ncbi:hypothetical protein S245_005472, partial [Arachis hypogaea]
PHLLLLLHPSSLILSVGYQRFFSHQPHYRRRPLPHHQHSSLSRSSPSSPFSHLRCRTLVQAARSPSTGRTDRAIAVEPSKLQYKRHCTLLSPPTSATSFFTTRRS